MTGINYFSKIRINKPMFKRIENAEQTAEQWQKILQSGFHQKKVFCKNMKCYLKSAGINVREVIGDVVCIEICKYPFDKQWDHEYSMMYINAVAIDILLVKMELNKKKSLSVFGDEIQKHFHDASDASRLVIGYMQRNASQKKIHATKIKWKALMDIHTPRKQLEIKQMIKTHITDCAEKEMLLRWF